MFCSKYFCHFSLLLYTFNNIISTDVRRVTLCLYAVLWFRIPQYLNKKVSWPFFTVGYIRAAKRRTMKKYFTHKPFGRAKNRAAELENALQPPPSLQVDNLRRRKGTSTWCCTSNFASRMRFSREEIAERVKLERRCWSFWLFVVCCSRLTTKFGHLHFLPPF